MIDESTPLLICMHLCLFFFLFFFFFPSFPVHTNFNRHGNSFLALAEGEDMAGYSTRLKLASNKSAYQYAANSTFCFSVGWRQPTWLCCDELFSYPWIGCNRLRLQAVSVFYYVFNSCFWEGSSKVMHAHILFWSRFISSVNKPHRYLNLDTRL